MSYPINSVDATYHRRFVRALLPLAVAVAAAIVVPQTHWKASAQTQTAVVVLSPVDTYISLNSTNYNTAAMIATYTWPDYQPANAILMKFDLSKLPAGAVIQSAKLRLSLIEADQKWTPTYNISAHKIIGRNPDLSAATGYVSSTYAAWAPSNCCWSGVPLGEGNISAPYTTIAVGKTLGTKTWTITNMVQEWLADPSSNFGLLLHSDASVPQDRYRYFASSEYSDPALRPKLEVTFTANDATPPTVSLTSPTSGAVLSNSVAVTAAAQDANGIAGVQFRVNGNALGQEVQSAPYAINWNTTTMSDGTYTLTAVARDSSGNTATSADVSVDVKNGAITILPLDTTINLDSNNNSAWPLLTTYTWPEYRVANAIIMRFDLSSIPAGATVQDAALNMAVVEADSGPEPTYTITAHKILNRTPSIAAATGYTYDGTNAWSPSGCCYNGIPLAQADISSPYDQQAVDKTPGYKKWNLTRMVQEWIATPSSNRGVLLNSDATKTKDRYRYFASTENTNASLRPYLTVRLGSGTGGTVSTTTAPTVSITSPASGATVAGTAVMVTASAQGASGIAGVQFRVNGNVLGQEVRSAPYSVTWNTTTLPDGAYTLTAVARDANGNTATSAGLGVNVRNSAVTILPSDTSIALDANNNSASPLLRTYTWPEYEVANAILLRFDLSSIPAGAAVESATLNMALEVADSGPEPTYTVTAHKIINRTPVITGASGYTYDGTNAWAPSGCCYSNVPLAQGDISSPYDQQAIDKTLGYKAWDLTRMVQEWIANPSSNRGVLLNSDATKWKDRYRYFASTKNADASRRPYLSVRLGSGSSSDGTASGDSIAPTVSMTSPAAGGTVSGSSVTVLASASDNVGVVGVQFQLDGADLGGEDLSSPYSTAWNSTSAANGTHTLTAVARDAAGNRRISSPISITVSNTTTAPPPSSGLSALYPGDVGIETNPNVLFVEQFEEGSVASIVPRWGDAKNPEGMQLTTEVPPGTPAGHALSIPWVGGGVNNGGHLYKMLNPGIDDVIYVRYYMKYPSTGNYSHTGIWIGGSNPMSAWPDPIAGSKPNGDDRFIAAGEQNNLTHAFEHYNYWMGMHPDGVGSYWGNFLLNNPAVQANPGQWVCLEEMVKMNNPTSAWNGEHALWINGVKVSHLGQGFPNGYWSGGRFTQDPSGTPFEGFQWRSTDALNINWIWLQNYAPSDPAGFSSTILFDHVVVAKTYIGCLQ